MKKICKECGAKIELKFGEHLNTHLEISQLCFKCYYWMQKVENKDPNNIRVDGFFYHIGRTGGDPLFFYEKGMEGHTAQNYFSFLEESYLIFLIEKFSFKFKEKVISPRKVYAIDTGLIHTFPTRSSKDIGRLYENIVAIELMRKRAILPDFEVYYWQNYSGKEVDFILKRGLKVIQMIQVCFDLDNYDTRMRQYKSLVKASKELNCSDLLVITSEKKSEEAYKDKTIKVVPLWEWLLK